MRLTIIFLSGMLALLSGKINAAERTLKIYHDSDYSNHQNSADAMRMGFLTALAEIEHDFPGVKFELIKKDHRGNSNRSLLHMRQYLKDPQALAMVGGLHSPPYIKHRKFINEQQILLLIPWAAGGPITRFPSSNNSVFRLSIDDTKAGFRIVEFAQQKMQCQRPHLLLERTPWGESNHKTMTQALGKSTTSAVTWFSWDLKQNEAKIMLRNTLESGPDCLLFVGNAVEGRAFVEAMAALPKNQRVPIISHWGITGGSFYQQVKDAINTKVDLHFIQSCFSLRDKPYTDNTQQVINTAIHLFPTQFSKPELLPAPAGFIHSYDLAKIFFTSLKSIDLKADIVELRQAVREKLEALEQPVDGLIKRYVSPFSKWSAQKSDAHEALGLEDFCMARYDTAGGISVLPN
ncbi:MAG: hypothetical protein CL811_09890 [Colwelliaceae bacterium]|nr:hypothetical protein [Colwelliaceae bacterium]